MKIPDNPLFRANSLYVQDATGNPIGLYNYIVDTLVLGVSETPKEQGSLSYVTAHETSHRLFTHQPGYNTFEIIRRLTAISYRLISNLLAITIGSRSYLKGRTLNELRCESSTQEITRAAESIIKRIQFVEKHIDMGSRGIEMVAEMEAIDSGTAVFQEQVEDDIQGTIGDNIHFSQIWLLKTQLIEALISNYPSDYSGYNMSFGSFQNAMREAWAGYSVINNNQVRQELLHLCTYILYLDENNTIQVLDPIKVITENASFCRYSSNEAISALSAHRQQLDLQSKKLIDTLEELLLRDIDDSPEKGFINALSQLVLKQLGGGMHLGSDTAMRSAHWSPTWSFLTFIWNEESGNGRVNFIWPYLADSDISSNLPKDWWKELLFYEALRLALKTGSSLFCPLRGWEKTASMGIRSVVTPEEVKCTDQCVIRHMMDALSWYSELIQGSFCIVEN